MNNSLKMVLVLGCVCVLSGAGLVFVYNYAQPQIEANQKKELKQALFKVLPQAKTFTTIEKDGEEIYIGEDETGRLQGYAFTAKGNGYQSQIILMAGVDQRCQKVLGIEILESVETPGLGGMIESNEFKSQFKNLLITPKIVLSKKEAKKPNEIQAITGATISSEAVINILNEKIKRIKGLLEK